MVLQGISDLDERMKSKYPGISNYGVCQSRAFVQGLLGMVVGGGSGAMATIAAKHYIPAFPTRYNILYIAGAAVLAGYAVTARASKKCQEALLQSQMEKNAAETRSNHVDPVGRKIVPPRVAELASDTQRTTLTTEQLLPETGGD